MRNRRVIVFFASLALLFLLYLIYGMVVIISALLGIIMVITIVLMLNKSLDESPDNKEMDKIQ